MGVALTESVPHNRNWCQTCWQSCSHPNHEVSSRRQGHQDIDMSVFMCCWSSHAFFCITCCLQSLEMWWREKAGCHQATRGHQLNRHHTCSYGIFHSEKNKQMDLHTLELVKKWWIDELVASASVETSNNSQMTISQHHDVCDLLEGVFTKQITVFCFSRSKYEWYHWIYKL